MKNLIKRNSVPPPTTTIRSRSNSCSLSAAINVSVTETQLTLNLTIMDRHPPNLNETVWLRYETCCCHTWDGATQSSLSGLDKSFPTTKTYFSQTQGRKSFATQLLLHETILR